MRVRLAGLNAAQTIVQIYTERLDRERSQRAKNEDYEGIEIAVNEMEIGRVGINAISEGKRMIIGLLIVLVMSEKKKKKLKNMVKTQSKLIRHQESELDELRAKLSETVDDDELPHE